MFFSGTGRQLGRHGRLSLWPTIVARAADFFLEGRLLADDPKKSRPPALIIRDGGQPLLSDLAGPAEKRSDLSQNPSPRHDC